MDLKPDPAFIAREKITYKPGDRVRILGGRFAGQIMTVRLNADAYVALMETKKNEFMGKANIEPELGLDARRTS